MGESTDGRFLRYITNSDKIAFFGIRTGIVLIEVYSLKAGGTTMCPCWVRVATFAGKPVLDLISDWFHMIIFLPKLAGSCPGAAHVIKQLYWEMQYF